MSHWIMAPLLLPLLAGMVNLLLVRHGPGPQRLVSLLTTAALLPVAILLLLRADSGEIVLYQLGNWPAPFGISLVLDRLSAMLLVLTALLALPALVAATAGDDRRGENFHVLFPLQLFGINGAFLTGDLFNLFVFFEVMLIASYGLALHGGGRDRVRAGLHYVVLNLIGSSLFLVAIGTLYGIAGTLNMADLAIYTTTAAVEQTPLLRAAALLLLTVFALKAAVLPLHLWLPALYSAGIAPVAALFAIMTKVGVYAILRTFTLILPVTGPGADVAAVLPAVALLTIALGALGALGAHRLTVLIAYLVVVSVGTLLAGISLFTVPGLTAALFYLPHTTLITAGLFLLAALIAGRRGAVGDQLQAVAVNPGNLLGGLFFLAAIAVAGMPPLGGFLGKLLLLQAVPPPQAPWLWTVVLVGGLAAIVALSRAGSSLFWRTEGEGVAGTGLPLPLLTSTVLLLALTVALTVWAAPLTRYAEATATQLLRPQETVEAVLGREAGR
ncbi:monovalent cation/H+ antiporter subunit D [Desulfoprunum benzoelyticum]|uniref:Multicomponent K+:H+ antiporter subunit D n=1 Tax=Desulfoprunum benzoelyticum TaxID=1506996 RepID=A0A840UP65_9BACT|nr:monovalent cation/H+ antiporter subunit D [Desulfoprunum benzoelyticum]MBB5347425.1 multicomponent K+:H+ antiporter subunit D [Desulfoprunum benzoelyticum]MBM9529695.1 monovalent cation/H+ antiporter subunit D [Desulfoprunum benzoelyticum]